MLYRQGYCSYMLINSVTFSVVQESAIFQSPATVYLIKFLPSAMCLVLYRQGYCSYMLINSVTFSVVQESAIFQSPTTVYLMKFLSSAIVTVYVFVQHVEQKRGSLFCSTAFNVLHSTDSSNTHCSICWLQHVSFNMLNKMLNSVCWP